MRCRNPGHLTKPPNDEATFSVGVLKQEMSVFDEQK